MNEEQLGMLYDILYDKADKIIRRYNPCEHDDDGECIHTRKKECGNCCMGCEYLSTKGCTIRALWCKTWLCGMVSTAYPDLDRELEAVRRVAYKYHLFVYREGKEEAINQHITIKRNYRER